MNTTVAAVHRQRDRKFTLALTLTIMGVIFAGFARTYYLNAFFAQLTLSWMVHLHGFIFSTWFVVLLVQTVLVMRGRTDLHRRVGVVGAALACIMVPLGLVVAIHAAKYGSISTPPDVPRLVFLAVPFFDIVVFGTLVTAGLLYRRKPQIHKRLIVLSTLSIITPAMVRIPLRFIHAYGLFGVFCLADSFALAYIAYDTISHKRLHPACLWGGLLIVASVPIRFAVSGTATWLAFAGWLTE